MTWYIFLLIWFGVGSLISLILLYGQKQTKEPVNWLMTLIFIPFGLAGLVVCVYCGIYVLIEKYRGEIK